MFGWHYQIFLQESQIKEKHTSLSFIQENRNLVCIGAPGAGKTYLAIVLSLKLVKKVLKQGFDA